ncbi:MAG: sulfatase-like hydrolase/transferase, partial [Phycisphaeraceae bacterium]|nr:sulfatase-like hydrolase/transferase [Phycisphaeraceae bacterium]
SLAPDCGFDTFCLWNYPGARRERFWNPGVVRDGTVLETTKEDYGPDIFTDFIIEFMEKNKERPFFVYYPMVLVHAPFLPTPDSQVAAGKNKKEQALANFRDMTAYADKCVGRIVDALEKNGLRKNTVVIYTTDNGTGRSLTYPFRDEMRDGEKAYATDGGSHAPLIINCPGTVPAGIVTDDLVEFSDVMPTLAQISGATLPDVTLDGRSFWPQCLGQKGNPRKWIFQYYYPKFTKAAEKHGQGINGKEIVWAQDQQYKLYRDGSLYATTDRHETSAILLGTGPKKAEDARHVLQAAIGSMPTKAAKLTAAKKSSGQGKTRQREEKK